MDRVTVAVDGVGVREPLLVRPFQGGMTGWIVVFGAIIIELVGGAVTNQKFLAAALPLLITPVAVAYAFGVVQWWQVRSYHADPVSWWHLGAIVAALLIWGLWPTAPGALDGMTGSAANACKALPTDNTADCLHHAAQALDASNLAWWLTLVLIGISALMVRRSRIAVWAALPAAFAGCQVATHFLQQLILHYQAVV
jgi:hypothetical protein